MVAFACCHPALAEPARVALTLRLLGGLSAAEIAAAFLVPERTIAQRITRAKRKIADAHIPFRVPREADLAAEAVRLARQLVELLPGQPEPRGLLALTLLSEARRPARCRRWAIWTASPSAWTGYHAFYATRADLLRRLGRTTTGRSRPGRNRCGVAHLRALRDSLRLPG